MGLVDIVLFFDFFWTESIMAGQPTPLTYVPWELRIWLPALLRKTNGFHKLLYNKDLIRPCFWGLRLGGGWLTSHKSPSFMCSQLSSRRRRPSHSPPLFSFVAQGSQQTRTAAVKPRFWNASLNGTGTMGGINSQLPKIVKNTEKP